MKRRLGIVASCLDGLDTISSLEKIKAAGFDCFFTGEYKMDEVTKIKEKALDLGLDYEFIHAPFHSINEIWTQGDGYLEVMEYMRESIDSASKNKIPYVITHLSSGWSPPHVNDLGFARVDELVKYARERGVTLAFENLRVLGNLVCIMDRYADVDNVSFCFDCGHEHCFTKTVSLMDIFTTRVCCTHIHDNQSRGLFEKDGHFDLHMLPFDGTYDYSKMMQKLNEYNYQGALMLEVWQSYDEYKRLSHEEFLSVAFERISKIANMQ
jgi:sugar phosphate isomerase/epimerase